MPYLRLHSAEVSIEQKRVISQKLIEITMHAFCLRPEERYQISIEFISDPKSSAASWVGRRSSLRDADCLFEVLGRDLTEEKKRVFAGETAAVLPIAAFGIEDANSPSAFESSRTYRRRLLFSLANSARRSANPSLYISAPRLHKFAAG